MGLSNVLLLRNGRGLQWLENWQRFVAPRHELRGEDFRRVQRRITLWKHTLSKPNGGASATLRSGCHCIELDGGGLFKQSLHALVPQWGNGSLLKGEPVSFGAWWRQESRLWSAPLSVNVWITRLLCQGISRKHRETEKFKYNLNVLENILQNVSIIHIMEY